jgi:RNA polymerase sigma-70 factor (ECF subfamily)
MDRESDSDEALLAAIGNKDRGALEIFYERHKVVAYSIAVRILGNTADAEDVLQDVFLNVWRSAATFRVDRGNPRSWLLSLVHHRSIDRLRGRQRRPVTVAMETEMDLPDNTDVWRDVAQNLTRQQVGAALEGLPADQREAIELAYFKGYTHQQIAELTAVPLGTVKGRMRLGLHKLRGLLQSPETGLALE